MQPAEADLFAEVCRIVAETLRLPLESVEATTGYGQPAVWDSLNHLRLVMEVEERFQLRFTLEQIDHLTSVAEIYQAVQSMQQ